MSWNPQAYLSFADERTRPAADLLARVRAGAPLRVADLGCGPGNSTGLLAARWAGAVIDGVDSSAAMLAQAARSGVAANWMLADLRDWVPEAGYDVLFSNATLQWLSDHAVLLPRLMGFVRVGGTFAFQVPENFSAPSHLLMREVADSGPWADRLREVRTGSVLSAEEYYAIVSPLARAVDIWQTTYLHVLEGDDPVLEWVGATGLRPFVQALEGEMRAGFLAAYRAKLRAAYPKRADGRTLFAFRRLFVVAEV
ncbi:MAG TPA: trans-aconitate 2-methyltransferase [Rhizomicrobium sp.]|nr:trans-aconitate 2-methyltransferase [Rhizomicrobium sp.]